MFSGCAWLVPFRCECEFACCSLRSRCLFLDAEDCFRFARVGEGSFSVFEEREVLLLDLGA